MKLKTQIVIITLGLAASTSLLWSADRPARETTPTIQGVWQERICSANCERAESALESPIPEPKNRSTATAPPTAYASRYGSARHPRGWRLATRAR